MKKFSGFRGVLRFSGISGFEEMVRTMFTDRDGRVILDEGPDSRSVRPTAYARAGLTVLSLNCVNNEDYRGNKSILRTYGDHVATRLWDDVDRGELRVFSNGKKLKEVVIENDEVKELVKSFGLYPLLKCSYDMIDKGLISAFVERWHRDTNNFHLPIGEMTITLDDVSSLLYIPITGAFFSVNIFNKDEAAELLGELVGVSLADAYVEFNMTWTTTVRYSWLLDVYHQRCADQHWQMARPQLMWGDMHGVLLRLLTCTTIFEKRACIRLERYPGVYEHFPALCANCCRLSQIYDEDYPRALRWKPKRDKDLVIPFRKALDEIDVDDICWTPYIEHRLKRPFEVVSLFRGWIRWGPKMYAHLPDRISHPYIIRREPVYVAPTVAEPADDDHALDVTTEILGRQLVLRDGIALVKELILVLRSQRGGGRDSTNVVPYRRRHRQT
uniref:Protein MAIN-LIKE 1-like n=1 Tax=Cicer arietinum TaxID=3827 RepID=A0A1S2XNR6_CICAR|nr:protein MAIN-LIKE 1-like [Cicer arietinum]